MTDRDRQVGGELGCQFPSVQRSAKKAQTLVSSLDSFSNRGVQNIRSLHELLQAIQPLLLEYYEGTELSDMSFLGEGASFRVIKCMVGVNKQIVAVKQVKLPSASSDISAFQSRIACVLKDIEVMSHPPLAQCDQILSLFGYGWRLQGGDIPFLVTEYAPYGTIRQYLQHNTGLSGMRKWGLCRDVATGLEWLHCSGVVHGDLKLENVLVVPISSGKTVEDSEVVAKISDFGCSILLSLAPGSQQERYLGTALYNPPEVTNGKCGPQKPIDFQKCDMWSFGLLCWEVMNGGKPYYENDSIYMLLWKTDWGSRINPTLANVTAEAVLQYQGKVQQELPDISKAFANGPLGIIVPPFTRIRLTYVFKNTLVIDPAQRIKDVTALPFKWGARLNTQSSTAKVATRPSEWTFDCFERRNTARILWSAKTQMASDFQRSAVNPSQSLTSARGCFQYALAHITGFGLELNTGFFYEWLRESHNRGFASAGQFIALLNDHKALHQGQPPEDLKEESQKARAEIGGAQHKLHYPKCIERHHECYLDFVRKGLQRRNQTCVLSLLLPSQLGAKLLDACRVGNSPAALAALRQGADPRIRGADGCTTLHWLFMFPKLEVGHTARELCKVARALALAESSATTNVPVDEWLNLVVSDQLVIDPQLPIKASGSPLAFAVAAASYAAVATLLALGADPMTDFETAPLFSSRPRCPVLLASYLHLPSIFSLFEKRLLRLIPEMKDSLHSLLKPMLTSLCECSLVERRLLHGEHIMEMRDEMLQRLGDLCKTFAGLSSHPICLSRGKCPLLLSIELAETFIKTFPETFSSTLGPIGDYRVMDASRRVTVAMILGSVEAVSRGTYDWESSVALMEYVAPLRSMLNDTHLEYNDTRALNIAIRYRREDVFNWLMDKQVAINIRDKDGRTPLHQVVGTQLPQSGCLERLLEAGALPNEQDAAGKTPLHLAVANCASFAVRLLLKRGADVEAACHNKDRSIHLAAQLGDIPCLRAIFEANPTVDAPDKNGNTALSIASLQGLAHSATALLDRGANPSLAIHSAVRSGRAKILALLLDYGADKDFQSDSSKGATPLATAAYLGDVGMVKLLIRERAKVSLKDENGRSALHLALIERRRYMGNIDLDGFSSDVVQRYDEVIKNLLQDADPLWLNDVDESGRSYLHYATMCTQNQNQNQHPLNIRELFSKTMGTPRNGASIVVRLLSSGVNAEARDRGGRLSIHYAVSYQNVEALCTFLRWDGGHRSVNETDEDGNTPLHLAMICCVGTAGGLSSIHMCLALVQDGANCMKSNRLGETPFSIAGRLRWAYQQQFVRASMLLSIQKTKEPRDRIYIELLQQVVFAAAQIPSREGKHQSSFQLWSRHTKLHEASWPKTEDSIVRLGDVLLAAGADLFAGGHESWASPLEEVVSVQQAGTCDTILAGYLLRQHTKSMQHLLNLSDSQDRLPPVDKADEYYRQHKDIIAAAMARMHHGLRVSPAGNSIYEFKNH
ncbi:MAG: hypothetical protein M1840_008431 [Geoglossum simile]|nr:MAG: hypothetical protein M1840_008431 [Geoglossum simile]